MPSGNSTAAEVGGQPKRTPLCVSRLLVTRLNTWATGALQVSAKWLACARSSLAGSEPYCELAANIPDCVLVRRAEVVADDTVEDDPDSAANG